jgi:hypothetical protein
VTRPLPFALTVVIAVLAGVAIAVCFPPASPPAPATDAARSSAASPPHLREGLPDCPTKALGNLRGPDALLCWFDDATFGPWHQTSNLDIHGVTIAKVIAGDRRVAMPVATRLVAQGGADADEVLVYASDRGETRFTRVRWTRRSGYEITEFEVK